MTGGAAAFAPGHITGLFEICDDAEDPAQIGSRGAGFSVNLGVRSRVRISREGFPGVTCRVDGRPFEATTTRAAVELLVPDKELCVEVDQTMMLPVSQGFGMSAAGALSAAMACAQILGRTRQEAVWAAHSAEVVNRSGLGDVVGAALGGYETRREPGVEPYGRIEPFQPGQPVNRVLLAVVDEAIETRKILRDPEHRARIRDVGARLLRMFHARPSLVTFAEASRRFAIESRLASPRVAAVLEALGPDVLASQCMLGGSVFAFGADPSVRKELSRHGPVIEALIETRGARLIADTTAEAQP